MARRLPGVSRNAVSVVFRPSSFVQAQDDTFTSGWVPKAYVAGRLTAFYVFNLLVYTLPLTLSGVGIQSAPAMPEWWAPMTGAITATPVAFWELCYAMVFNTVFLFAGSALTFLSFHGGVILTRSNRGILQSFHTVVNSTGVYLAAIWTIVIYIQQTEALAVTRNLLIALQSRFFYQVVQSAGLDLVPPGYPPEQVNLAEMTGAGELALVAFVVAALYYFYSLYLGARINHETGRLDSVLTILLVAMSPVAYALGSAIFTLVTSGQTVTPLLGG